VAVIKAHLHPGPKLQQQKGITNLEIRDTDNFDGCLTISSLFRYGKERQLQQLWLDFAEYVKPRAIYSSNTSVESKELKNRQ
jgi:hypothetical protein